MLVFPTQRVDVFRNIFVPYCCLAIWFVHNNPSWQKLRAVFFTTEPLSCFISEMMRDSAIVSAEGK